MESSQICITAAESWMWPVVAINKNKRLCGVIVTLFLVSMKGSLQNMSGSLSVRGCTLQPFLQKATAFLERKIKLFWEKGLGIYLKSSLWGSGSLASLSAERRAVCALGTLPGDGEQPLPTCSSPATGTAGELLKGCSFFSGQWWSLSHLPHCQGNGVWWDPILGLYELL